MPDALVKGTDGKFHLCKVYAIEPCYLTLYPTVWVRAYKGCPFNDNRTAQIEMSPRWVSWVSKSKSVCTLIKQARQTEGLATYICHAC